ncbi:hypothetical protein CsSME_00017305 [Camellia sinensis var. sinensis]
MLMSRKQEETTIKVTNIISSSRKCFLAICIVVSITFFSYSTFSRHPGWLGYSKSNPNFLHFDHTTKISTDTSLLGSEQQTNISHIVFGISSSVKTWTGRRDYCELWWKPNITRGFVWLDEKPPDNVTWRNTSPPYMVSQNTSRFKYTCWYGARYAIRTARIVKESFELGLENVRWFVMGDDDTVFFLENLVTVLGKYDHNQMYYIGGNSESVEQDVIHSYAIAYGGGGFAVSYALAAELVRILDGCIDRYAELYGGDQKVGACVTELGVPLTVELGFHQVSGFYRWSASTD